jgi:hypothetical protein
LGALIAKIISNHFALYRSLFPMRTPDAARKVVRVKASGKLLDETYKTYRLDEIAYAGVDTIALRNKLITLFADTFRVLDPARAKEFLSELPTFATASPPSALSAVAENAQQIGQLSRPAIYSIVLLPNALSGLAIGVTNSSLVNVVLHRPRSSARFHVVKGSGDYDCCRRKLLLNIERRGSNGNGIESNSFHRTHKFRRPGVSYNVIKPGESTLIRVLRVKLGEGPPPGAFQAQDIVNTIGPRLKATS